MKKILVVIDMQNDFIDGALGTKEAEAIVDNVIAKIGEYPADCIYATRDTHQKNYLETMEGKKLPVVHCVEGTKGWELNERVEKALAGAVIMNKPSFGSPELADMLAAEAAVLFHLQPVRVIFLVLFGVVVALLALGAGQNDLHSHIGTS